MSEISNFELLKTYNMTIDTVYESPIFPLAHFQAELNTDLIGRTGIEFYNEVSSTNDAAIQQGKIYRAEEGKLFITDYQSAGRGRYGRTWDALPGRCLLVSIIFTHRLKNDEVHLPNLIGALSIAQAISSHTTQPTKIKHPNDVLINNKKVAGVLTEIEYDKDKQPFFVLGFGVNVNITLEEFPCSLQDIATSLFIESKDKNSEMCRGEILIQILTNLERNYFHLKSGNIQQIKTDLSTWEEVS